MPEKTPAFQHENPLRPVLHGTRSSPVFHHYCIHATVMYGAGDVRIENVSDPRIIDSTDAIVEVMRACICGSNLWPYQEMDGVF